MRKSTFTILICFLGALGALAQDRQFSQFYASPLTLNPALAGAFQGRYRVGIVYRDQYRDLVDENALAFAGGVDLRFPLKYRRSRSADAVGAGILFSAEKDPYGYSLNQLALAASFHKSLNRNNNQFLTAGFSLGIAQRSISFERIVFQDQFDGLNGFLDQTGESLPENNYSYGDLAVGLNYTYSEPRGLGVFAGVAMHHVNQPQVSFFYDKEDEIKKGDDKLSPKLVAHVGFQIPISQRFQILPRAIFLYQNPHMAFNGGTNFRYLVNDLSGIALHFGGWARVTKDEISGIELDAVVTMVGFEYKNFLLGFSYDLPMTNLARNDLGEGALEISLAFLGNYNNETVLCPKF